MSDGQTIVQNNNLIDNLRGKSQNLPQLIGGQSHLLICSSYFLLNVIFNEISPNVFCPSDTDTFYILLQ